MTMAEHTLSERLEKIEDAKRFLKRAARLVESYELMEQLVKRTSYEGPTWTDDDIIAKQQEYLNKAKEIIDELLRGDPHS